MYVTARLDYGLRALAVLAAQPDGASIRAAEIATGQGLPLPYVAAILNELRRAGLVLNRRGSAGGYRLARTATEISLADAVAALKVWPVDVHSPPVDRHDPLGDRLAAVWRSLQGVTEGLLASISLADVASGRVASLTTSGASDSAVSQRGRLDPNFGNRGGLPIPAPPGRTHDGDRWGS